MVRANILLWLIILAIGFITGYELCKWKNKSHLHALNMQLNNVINRYNTDINDEKKMNHQLMQDVRKLKNEVLSLKSDLVEARLKNKECKWKCAKEKKIEVSKTDNSKHTSAKKTKK